MLARQQIQQFISGFPSPLLRLIKTIQSGGVRAILVGGSVRNWLHHNEDHPLDFDFEIRHSLSLQDVANLIRQCHPRTMEELPFNILRLGLTEDIQVELAPPRREIFGKKPWFKHSDFKADIDPSLTLEEAWRRRDFTINAIGIDMDSATLMDPYNGLANLKNNLLRPCGPSFFCDPVRFLRLIRFQCQYGFSLHPDIRTLQGQFNLKGLTPLYFFKESFKFSFIPFVSRFFDAVHRHSIPLPEGLEPLAFLSQLESPKPKNTEEVLLSLVHGKPSFSFAQLQLFTQYAEISPTLLKQQWDFRQNLERLHNIDEQFFQKQSKALTFEEFLKLDEIRIIKKLHRYWLGIDRLHLFFDRMDQLNPSLSQVLLRAKNLFPPHSEGYDPFPADLPPEHRSTFRLYRHLQTL